MILARVIGNSVSSVKHPTYVGQKVMVVQPVETDTHTPKGTTFLALDSVHAGVGDLVVAAREGLHLLRDHPLHLIKVHVRHRNLLA